VPGRAPDSDESREAALVAARAAAAKQAEGIAILDVHGLIVITDYFVICSASTERQVKTIVEEVEKQLKERHGVAPLRIEGAQESRWVLMDFGDFWVHVFRDALLRSNASAKYPGTLEWPSIGLPDDYPPNRGAHDAFVAAQHRTPGRASRGRQHVSHPVRR